MRSENHGPNLSCRSGIFNSDIFKHIELRLITKVSRNILRYRPIGSNIVRGSETMERLIIKATWK